LALAFVGSSFYPIIPFVGSFFQIPSSVPETARNRGNTHLNYPPSNLRFRSLVALSTRTRIRFDSDSPSPYWALLLRCQLHTSRTSHTSCNIHQYTTPIHDTNTRTYYILHTPRL
jgi:hypothetical protein